MRREEAGAHERVRLLAEGEGRAGADAHVAARHEAWQLIEAPVRRPKASDERGCGAAEHERLGGVMRERARHDGWVGGHVDERWLSGARMGM